MTLVFHVQGSSVEPYTVTFEQIDGELKGYCTCPAGDNGQFCKHRVNLLYGVVDNVIDMTDSKMEQLHQWLSGSRVEVVLKEVTDAEREVAEANRRLKDAKKNLSKALR